MQNQFNHFLMQIRTKITYQAIQNPVWKTLKNIEQIEHNQIKENKVNFYIQIKVQCKNTPDIKK